MILFIWKPTRIEATTQDEEQADRVKDEDKGAGGEKHRDGRTELARKIGGLVHPVGGFSQVEDKLVIIIGLVITSQVQLSCLLIKEHPQVFMEFFPAFQLYGLIVKAFQDKSGGDKNGHPDEIGKGFGEGLTILDQIGQIFDPEGVFDKNLHPLHDRVKTGHEKVKGSLAEGKLHQKQVIPDYPAQALPFFRCRTAHPYSSSLKSGLGYRLIRFTSRRRFPHRAGQIPLGLFPKEFGIFTVLRH